MRADSNRLAFCCGIVEIGSFDYQDISFSSIPEHTNSDVAFYVSSFINTHEQREAYLEMKKYFKLIYQSPVRVNPNSGNEIFMCIYTDK
jgi:hypothetical protein